MMIRMTTSSPPPIYIVTSLPACSTPSWTSVVRRTTCNIHAIGQANEQCATSETPKTDPERLAFPVRPPTSRPAGLGPCGRFLRHLRAGARLVQPAPLAYTRLCRIRTYVRIWGVSSTCHAQPLARTHRDAKRARIRRPVLPFWPQGRTRHRRYQSCQSAEAPQGSSGQRREAGQEKGQ